MHELINEPGTEVSKRNRKINNKINKQKASRDRKPKKN